MTENTRGFTNVMVSRQTNPGPSTGLASQLSRGQFLTNRHLPYAPALPRLNDESCKFWLDMAGIAGLIRGIRADAVEHAGHGPCGLDA